jgi:small-conductance mechanosensitive channel
MVEEAVTGVVHASNNAIDILTIVAVTALAVALAWPVDILVRRLAGRYWWMTNLSRRGRRPFRFLVGTLAALLAVTFLAPPIWGGALSRYLLILVIIAAGWLLTSLLFVLEEGALPRLRTDVSDNRRARAARTQLIVLRRVTGVTVAVLAVASILLTFREVRAIGTSLLASAGVVAAVAAFAANALLSNVVAGLQIAFSGSLRLEDVVVVENEWGRVEEITLTYVVLHVWDDRRLVLPTSYFTNKPFQNWTRTASPLIGEVLLDVDWMIDLDPLREQLRQMLSDSALWDGRVCVVQMVDAVGGSLTVRALVSAPDAPTLWDLRCMAREHLARCVRGQRAQPRSRAELEMETRTAAYNETYHPHRRRGDRFFSGDRESRDRGDSFKGPQGDDAPEPSPDAPAVDGRPAGQDRRQSRG